MKRLRVNAAVFSGGSLLFWFLFFLFCLFLSGCSSPKPVPLLPPPFPVLTRPLFSPLTQSISSSPVTPRTNHIHIQYPPDATNFNTWYLEQSEDMTNWIILHQYGPLKPGSTNWDTVFQGTNRVRFWRMRGVNP